MIKWVSSDEIRADFAQAMSAMYRDEVPAYGDLISIVEGVNDHVLSTSDAQTLGLDVNDGIERISAERHGAIRVGTAVELSNMRRVFAIMGMEPVGYYDLSAAGIPVHSTAFRPVKRAALKQNPFRVFTSLLRLELISDTVMREKASEILAARQIFSAKALALTALAEAQGGLDRAQAADFISEVLETFRWQTKARVDLDTYQRLHDAHRLIADIVGFAGPHINHLTPRTLDIDAAQEKMVSFGLPAKAVIEGPPRRHCPILLRQTSFKALEEAVQFVDQKDGTFGSHTARFGEIEQRGIALTPKGRALYDDLLDAVREKSVPAPDGSNARDYETILVDIFSAFPDDWRQIHDQALGYFTYHAKGDVADLPLSELLDSGAVTITPIIYEDFLPVSAAGIFQSNLGDEMGETGTQASSKTVFIEALGSTPHDEFALYEAMQQQSLDRLFDR